MKLEKSLTGKVFIILYYTLSLAADIILMLFIWMITGSFWAALGVSFVLGIGIGVLGGELEFREHRKVKYGNYSRKRRTEETNNVIDFPVK
jgi:hypothetical protein